MESQSIEAMIPEILRRIISLEKELNTVKHLIENIPKDVRAGTLRDVKGRTGSIDSGLGRSVDSDMVVASTGLRNGDLGRSVDSSIMVASTGLTNIDLGRSMDSSRMVASTELRNSDPGRPVDSIIVDSDSATENKSTVRLKRDCQIDAITSSLDDIYALPAIIRPPRGCNTGQRRLMDDSETELEKRRSGEENIDETHRKESDEENSI